MAPKVCFLGAVRRRTMICCRNVKISASSAARVRNRSTTAQTMSLKRYLITDQHRPILGQPPVNRFATGTRGYGSVYLGPTDSAPRGYMTYAFEQLGAAVAFNSFSRFSNSSFISR